MCLSDLRTRLHSSPTAGWKTVIFFFFLILFSKAVKYFIYTQISYKYMTAPTKGYSALWPVIIVFFFFPNFFQGINNSTIFYKTFLFSSSSARTWRHRCFGLWKRRCRESHAPTAGEPVTCLPRSWSRASSPPNETVHGDDRRRIAEAMTRLRSSRNRLLLTRVNLWSRWDGGVFFFFKRLTMTSMGKCTETTLAQQRF